ncbi:MAG TPA: type II secretion system F family protein [Chthonomonadales bacterium]|nr:type II secretion system F family protein [Chthonomonadales bacterium]
MPVYAYIARDREGRTQTGTVEAANSALAAGKVRARGLQVERVRAVDEPPRRPVHAAETPASASRGVAEVLIFPVASGVPLKALSVFYRQLATLVNAGLPIYQALESLGRQTSNARLQSILKECQQHTLEGGPISDVMRRHTSVFGELQIEMIRAAEQGGMLDTMLHRVADYLEQELALRRLVSRLTLYPKLVALVAVLLLGRSFFGDFTPAISKLVIGSMGRGGYSVMQYLLDTVGFLALLAAAVFAVVAVCRVTLFQSLEARAGYERLKIAIPGVGGVVRSFALARFGRAFGALYGAGLPLNASIRTAGRASASVHLALAAEHAVLATERGATISEAFRGTGALPPLVLDMLRTGEQTGNIDAMMNKVSEYLEGEASSRAHLYAHVFSVALYLLVALMVGAAVVSFYTGVGSSPLGEGM